MLYTIECTWTMYGTMRIEADSEKEAVQRAYEFDGLPDGSYIEDSFTVEGVEEE